MDTPENTMRLAPGYGCIPEHQRNRGYEKLGYAPGEGGIRVARTRAMAEGELSDAVAAELDKLLKRNREKS
jgi:hypothetical protein